MPVHHPPQRKGDNTHVVALTSTTLGSLRLDSLREGCGHRGCPHCIREADDDADEPMKKTLNDRKPTAASSPVDVDGFSAEVLKAKAWSEMIRKRIPAPKTPTKTPPNEPEVINTWELMEGLEDASPLYRFPVMGRSFSLHSGQETRTLPRARIKQPHRDLQKPPGSRLAITGPPHENRQSSLAGVAPSCHRPPCMRTGTLQKHRASCSSGHPPSAAEHSPLRLRAPATRSGGHLSPSELVLACLVSEAKVSGYHADNVGPAIMGGFVLIRSYDPLEILRLEFPAGRDLCLVLASPDFEAPTKKMRAALPADVRMKDHIFNSSQAAALVSAVLQGDVWVLGAALSSDVIVGPKRAPLIPGMAGGQEGGLGGWGVRMHHKWRRADRCGGDRQRGEGEGDR